MKTIIITNLKDFNKAFANAKELAFSLKYTDITIVYRTKSKDYSLYNLYYDYDDNLQTALFYHPYTYNLTKFNLLKQ